ncbi:MAG: c-type cytochrome [Bauldia sp.]|nr:c-type cytochrome [Bauldia sp.]
MLVAGIGGLEAGTGADDGGEAPAISDSQIAFGKTVYQTRASCIVCHGWSGNGDAAERAAAPGLSLRETVLTRDQLIEVVKCGRPGTNMPYHDSFAYTDDRCYGVTAAELGDQMPTRTIASTLQRREIEAVVDYLIARVVGRGEITLAECEEFWEPGARACAEYQ